MTKATEARWAERIRQWRESGLSAEEFTEGKDYKASTLQWAASLLHEERTATTVSSSRSRSRSRTTRDRQRPESGPALLGEPPRILPVRTRSSEAASAEMIVEVGAARIRVTRGVDVALLGEVVRALEGVGR